VLRFAERPEPESVTRVRATLPEHTRTSLDTVLQGAARDGRRQLGAAVLTCVAAATGVLLSYAGITADDTSQTLSTDVDSADSVPIESIPTTPEPTLPPTTSIPTPAEELIDAIAASLGSSCVELIEPNRRTSSSICAQP
jgi:hypothetical protein